MRSLPEQVAEVAASRASAVAVQDGADRVSYQELMRRISQAAGYFQKAVPERGARVALVLPNSPDYVIALYGCWTAGLVAVPINADATAREIIKIVEHSQAELVVAAAGNRHLPEVSERSGVPIALVERGRGPRSPWDTDAGASGESACSLDDHALILYTSGTTGDPKGVLLSHGNLAANTQGIVDYLELTAEDSVLAVLPFHYSYGNSVLHTHLSVGARVVLGPSMVFPQKVTDALRAESISGFSGVPSTFSMLLDRTDWARDAPALRYLTQAGGAMGRNLAARLLENLRPHTRLYIMYGQTEASARLAWLPPDRLRDKMGSVGIPVEGVQLAVAGADGEPLGAGEVGEVVARGDNVMLGYWRNPTATRAVLRDGWLHTGDQGYVDADGFLFIKGRNGDMIKTGAHRVHPEEIEETVAELECVREVAACGVTDEVLGQTINIFVVGDEGAEAERMIMRYCREHLALHKRPKKIHWRTSLPRTSSGKVKRNQLAAQLAGDEG